MYKIRAYTFLPRKVSAEDYTGFATKEEARAKIDEMADTVLKHAHESIDTDNTTDVNYDMESDESSVTVHDHVNDTVYMYQIVLE